MTSQAANQQPIIMFGGLPKNQRLAMQHGETFGLPELWTKWNIHWIGFGWFWTTRLLSVSWGLRFGWWVWIHRDYWGPWGFNLLLDWGRQNQDRIWNWPSDFIVFTLYSTGDVGDQSTKWWCDSTLRTGIPGNIPVAINSVGSIGPLWLFFFYGSPKKLTGVTGRKHPCPEYPPI